MSNKSDKRKPKDIIRAARIQRTARITGVSTRQVRRVCNGEQKNEGVIDTMVRLTQAEEYLDNMLIQEVKKLVPCG